MSLKSSGLGIHVTDPIARLHVQGNGIISERLDVGGQSSGSSNLNVNGSLGFGFVESTNNQVLGDHSVVFANTSQSNVTLYLPKASLCTGKILNIKKSSRLNRLTLLAPALDGLDGQRGLIAEAGSSAMPSCSLFSDGQQWLTTSTYGTWNQASAFSDNLVGWWNFSDAVNDTRIKDLSVNDNTGSLSGGLTLSGCAISGNLGGGLAFDGVNDKIFVEAPSRGGLSESNRKRVPTGFKLFKKGEPVSASIWIKYDKNPSGYQTLLSYYDKSTATFNRFDVAIYGTGEIRFSDSTSSGKRFYYNIAQHNGTWMHIAVATSNAGPRKVWVNGTEVAIGGSQNLSSKVDYFTIGSRYHNGGDRYISCEMEDLKLFSKFLSETEVQQLYEAGRFL